MILFTNGWKKCYEYFNGLVQDCSNSSALAMELRQSCSKPSIYTWQSLSWILEDDIDTKFMFRWKHHYGDVIMGTVAYQITRLTIVYSTVYSGADQRKHQSSASLAFVRGLHRRPVNSPHKWPVTRKISPFDDVIMYCTLIRFHDTILPV